MKKLYYFLMTLVMTMVCSLQANAIKVTIKVDHPEAVTIKANNAPIEDSVRTENILDVAEYTRLEVVANNGYKLKSVTDSAGYAVGYIYNSSWSNYIYANNADDVYKVETITMKDYRDASCFITVDQASAVSVRRSGTYEEVTNLIDGDTVEVFYNSQEELPLIINSGKPLYEVTLDGTKVPGSTSFNVSPTQGQHINIVSQFPDKDCPITFEFTNGDKDFFTSVLVDSTEVGPEYYKGFTMKAGQELRLTGDLNAYKFNSMTVGSEQVYYMYGYYSTFITDTTKIIVDVEKYKTLSATLNVDNAEAVTVFTNMYNTDSKIDIVSGENPIQVKEQSNTLYFKANSGYYITKFEANDSNLIETNYDKYNKIYYFTVEDSMTITIETAQITYDDKMVVYLNEEPSQLTYFSLINTNREEYKATLKKGYNTIGFSQTQNPFDWSWYHADLNGNSLGGLVYINGILTEPQYSGSNNYSKTIQNGDVIKIYIGETDEKKYDVKFEGNTEAAVIKQDLITTIDGTATVTALPGTRYTFTAVEGKQITVKAGETELTAEEGVYTYDVNENTTFTISEQGTGIDTINGAQANQRKVYTIQGVRVSGTKLPAGIYVIDGKKTVVK